MKTNRSPASSRRDSRSLTHHLWLTVALVLASFAFAATSALAHGSSDAYLHLERAAVAANTTLRVDIALRDLDREVAIDADDDRAVTWGEVRRAWPAIREHLRPTIELRTNEGRACMLAARGDAELARRDTGAFVVLRHDIVCPDAAFPASVVYRLFESTDAGHRGLLRIDDAIARSASPAALLVLKPSAEPAPLSPALGAASIDEAGRAAGTSISQGGFLHFVREGIAHIASGVDHILFLVVLIVVTVFAREGGRWVVRESPRAIVGETLGIVTAFTLTHSITLGLAAAGVVTPASRWVESLIAASVLFTALDNLKLVRGRSSGTTGVALAGPRAMSMPRWALAGIFGFAHGFGFAGPLQELGLRGADLVMPLLAFNLGVEAGQLAVVALLLPVLLAGRRAPRYRSVVVPALSITVGLLAAAWLVERSLELDFGLPL
jgi:hypothetical protein